MSNKYFFEDKMMGGGQGFEYEIIKRPRLRSLKIVIQKNQEVQVLIPKSRLYVITQKQIEKILAEKFEFIMKARKQYGEKSKRQPELFNNSREHYYQHREMARELIQSKVDYYCRRYGFKYGRISIRNQRTRWGSCSAKGNLNFSYRLLFLLPEEQDYIVVHELCHLKEQNHSYRFWGLVEEILPNYKMIDRGIKNKS